MTKDASAIDALEAGLTMVVAALRKLRTSEDWVDQKSSPLGRRRHLEAVRRGALKGHRVNGLVLVRRADIDKYIAEHRVQPSPSRAAEAARHDARDQVDEVAEILAYRAPKRRAKAARS